MTLSTRPELVYSERDGQPMSDNTLQFRWIVLFKENLECLSAHDPQVFIAGDLPWYPVEGHPEIRVAPDATIVFGRSKQDRGSYWQGQRFLTTLERAEQLEQVQQQAEQAPARAERLAAQLRVMGVDPDGDILR